MSERPETIADIIAEMNRVEVCAGGEPCLRDYAMRFEAAHKREVDALNEQIADLRQQRDLWSKRSAELVEKCNEQYAKLRRETATTEKSLVVGDAAKLRGAVVEAQRCANGALLAISHENVPIQHMWDIIDICKAALSAPARNCDRFATKFDAKHEWEKVCKAGLPEQGPFEDWIFAPAKEKKGGVK